MYVLHCNDTCKYRYIRPTTHVSTNRKYTQNHLSIDETLYEHKKGKKENEKD